MLMGAVLWPQITGLNKLESIVEKMQETHAKISDVNVSFDRHRERQARLETLVAAMDTAKLDVREHDEFKTRINNELAEEASARKDADAEFRQAIRDLDAQLVKRPEIAAATKATDMRIDALAAHYDALQKQVNDALAGAVTGLAARAH